MSARSNELVHVEQMMESIYQELRRASLTCEVWWRCAWKTSSEDIRARMNNTAEGLAFAQIEQSLHIALVISLMTMFDQDARTASFSNIFLALEKSSLLAEIESDPRVQKINVTERIRAARARWQDTTMQHWLRTLRKLRNQYLAHRQMNPEPHGAKYGFEREVLTAATGMYEHLDFAISGRENGFEDAATEYASRADLFWTRVSRPASDDDG